MNIDPRFNLRPSVAQVARELGAVVDKHGHSDCINALLSVLASVAMQNPCCTAAAAQQCKLLGNLLLVELERAAPVSNRIH